MIYVGSPPAPSRPVVLRRPPIRATFGAADGTTVGCDVRGLSLTGCIVPPTARVHLGDTLRVTLELQSGVVDGTGAVVAAFGHATSLRFQPAHVAQERLLAHLGMVGGRPVTARPPSCNDRARGDGYAIPRLQA